MSQLESAVGYETDGRQGYYFYKEQKKPKQKKDQENEKSGGLAITRYSYKQLWNMPPAEFRKHLDQARELAVQTLSEQDVKYFMQVQDISRRKAAAFASVVSLVGQKNPGLSIEAVAPVTVPGIRNTASLRKEQIERTIKQAKENYALVMFAQEGCSYCQVQLGILQNYRQKYDWPIRVVDINERYMMAVRYGVETTPSLLLVGKEGGKSMLVAVGVVSLRELEQRLYRTIRYLDGKIKPEQWGIYEYQMNTGADPLYVQQKEE